MSYDVSKWVVKVMNDLRIPVSSLYKSERLDWHPRRQDTASGRVTFSIGDNTYIEGIVDEHKVLHVDSICAQGECSGSGLHYVIEPALTDSVGHLEVVRIWEEGDYIDRLKVNDGVVTSEPVEL